MAVTKDDLRAAEQELEAALGGKKVEAWTRRDGPGLLIRIGGEDVAFFDKASEAEVAIRFAAQVVRLR